LKTITFDEVVRLINFSRVTKIAEKPYEIEPNKWAFFSGINKVPGFEYRFDILYLFADATKDSIWYAAQAIKDPQNTQIVFAQSLNKWSREIQKQMSGRSKGISSTKEYLTLFIKDQLSVYQQKLIESAPENFIDPPYETPSGFKSRIPNPLLMMMLPDDSSQSQTGDFGILVAEPGQGKTYTAQHIASTLCSKNLLPIYIHSQQWASLSSEDLSSLWKTITHSFKCFGSSIDWIEGCEELFLNVTMKAGIFRLVFDGFDEYILWNRGKVDTNHAIQNLAKLSEDTGAPILVTSRTSFWESDISQESLRELKQQPGVFKIMPFDQNHARLYFAKCFKENEEKAKRALHIYDQLRKHGKKDDASNFAGRGFILYLIADLANDDEITPANVVVDGLTVIQWVMKALCQREQVRQKLPINADKQLEIFREMAEAIACGEKMTTLHLSDIICCIADEVTEISANILLDESKTKRGSFHDHPLVRKDITTGEWDFVHEQLFFNLLAEQILFYTKNNGDSLNSLFNRLSTGSKLRNLMPEIATCIVAQLTGANEQEVGVNKIREVLKSLLCCEDSTSCSHDTTKLEKVLASSIALLAVNLFTPLGSPRKDRTALLQSLMPALNFEGLHFSATISSMDFSNIEFKHCRFDNTIWANCKFTENTVFDSCHFIGGNIQKCEGFGLVNWKQELFDTEARENINAERIAAGKKKYTEESLRLDIESIIKKFIPKEGVGLKSVREDHLTSGIIVKSINRDLIINTLIRMLFEEHHISGFSGVGYHIKDSAKSSILHYAINGVYTGPLNEAYQELVQKCLAIRS